MIKKGLKVKVLAGRDKKKEGEVIKLIDQKIELRYKELILWKNTLKRLKRKKVELFLKKVLFISLT